MNDVGAEGTSLRPADEAARDISVGAVAVGGAAVGGALPCQRLPATTDSSKEAAMERRRRLRAAGYEIEQISGTGPEIDPEKLAGSVEGFIGFSRVPLGVAGPIRVVGSAANGEFFVPFATSEGTLVASFQHAFNAMNRSGGAIALCSDQQVGRAPCFEFASITQAAELVRWLTASVPSLQEVTAATSRFCRLMSATSAIVGNTVYVLFEFSTGDAAGQNMVTLATQAICSHMLAHMPTQPVSWLVESMMSGDKRATPLAFRCTRGRNVSAEIVLPSKQVERYWRTEPAKMERAWRQAVNGAAQTGAVGLQGNVANALAAIFIACGQDVACVAEATTALTRVERTPANEVYASVTLPNLIVGTVGGGTYLPTAHECLSMLGCAGGGHARKFAEICAAVALAGELAIVGAMASGQFAAAHASGGRKGATATDKRVTNGNGSHPS